MTDSDSPLPASVGEWTLAVLLSVTLGWTTVCLGGYRPETMVWSWLLTGCILAVHIGMLGFSAQRIHPATWAMIPFLVYAAVNAAFLTPVSWLGWRDWLGWAQMIGVFGVVVNGIRRRGPRAFLLGTILVLAVIAVVLACYQRFIWPDWLMLGRKQASQFLGRASGVFGVPNTLGAFLVLLIPPLVALTLQRGANAVQRILCGYLCAVLVVGLVLTISRGAWLALLLAVLVWPLCLRERSWEWRVSVSFAALTLVSIIGVATYAAVPHVKERFDLLIRDVGERSRPILWKASWGLFEDSPVVGTGAGSYNVLFERQRPEGFHDEPLWAHNDYLNTLSDYGAVGFFLCFGGIAYIAMQTLRANRSASIDAHAFQSRPLESLQVTRGLGIGLLAFAAALFVDFHLKLPAIAMIVAILGAECVQRCWPPPALTTATVSPLRQLGGIVGILAIGLITLAIALPTYRSEAARVSGREGIDRMARLAEPSLNLQKEVLTAAAPDITEATLIQSANGQAWSDLAYVSELWARLNPARAAELGKEAEESARRALEQSTVVPEFWIRLGVALDLQGRWGDGGEAFGKAIQLAPNNPIPWYYQAYHLSLTPATRPLALAAVKRSLALDPGLEPAIRLHQGLSLPHL